MINKSLFTSISDEYSTPQDLYDILNYHYHFTLDPCATDSNHKCAKYYTRKDDGLSKDWRGATVFCNPPYGRDISKWVEKCYNHFQDGGIAVMLLPARTDTKWFHTYIYRKPGVRIEFLKGRLKFGNSKNTAPFPSMVVEFGKFVEITRIDK